MCFGSPLPPLLTPRPAFPPDVQTALQVRVLMTFYCGKLDDTETIVPSLQGLVTLVTFPQFTSSDALEVVKAFVLAALLRFPTQFSCDVPVYSPTLK